MDSTRERLDALKSPFLLGRTETPGDAVVVMNATAHERRLRISQGAIEYETKTHGQQGVVFFDRRFDPSDAGRSEEPYHVQIGPNAGRLQRPAAEAGNAMAPHVNAFLNGVQQVQTYLQSEVDAPETQSAAAEIDQLATIARAIASETAPIDLAPTVAAFAQEQQVAGRIEQGALQQAPINEAKAFLHLWRSMDVAITRCPVCERQMRTNWAWCPYHADPEQLRDLFDQSEMRGAAINEGSFLQWLVEEQDNPTLADHVQSPYDDFDRLLVHWTEFDVLRQRDA